MGRWTYYSPFFLGLVLVAALSSSLIALEDVAALAPAARWAIVSGVALLAGLELQTAMVGAQGAFAQVLPVPGGRSIRGGGAQAAGTLLLLAAALGIVGGLIRSPESSLPSNVVWSLAGAALLGSGIIYFWCWPTAVPDFPSK